MWWLPHGKTKHLALAGPFRGQVAEAGNSQSVSKTPIDGSLNQIGCEEGKRDCLVDLSDAAALAACDGFGIGLGIGHEFVEPAASPRNRCDQQRAAFGTDGSGLRDRARPGAAEHRDLLRAMLVNPNSSVGVGFVRALVSGTGQLALAGLLRPSGLWSPQTRSCRGHRKVARRAAASGAATALRGFAAVFGKC